MLTRRQNLIETINGGNPDRFVNGHEAFGNIRTNPLTKKFPRPTKGQPPLKNGWGVTIQFPDNVPGPYPNHEPEYIVLHEEDMERWKEIVKAPDINFTEEDWAAARAERDAIDRNEYFATMTVTPGVFEQCHYLMSMVGCMEAFYEYPDEMHEMIDYITDFELRFAEQICKYVKPDCILHHDDWGSLINSFLSPEMFDEFIVPAFTQIYGYYKDHGVELIVHHSDSYAANLVPGMIKMGIDVWQGPAGTNNVKDLIDRFGPQITFMGEIDNTVVDVDDWTYEKCYDQVKYICEKNGMKYFVPCILGGCCHAGVSQACLDAVYQYNMERFGIATK
ncbi:MAG: uroporphyrinogen decarboxylase [Eubacteriaceae bacterium]|nr:uroporphyrinogen decarboxylase [Eubacteriaceae bacterium]